jgi:hypothetical protein
VALETTFRELSVCLQHLHDALNELQVTQGDKPPENESALADDVESVVLEMMGSLHEAQKAAVNGRKAVGHPPDLDLARRALTICQERFHRIEQQFAADLASYEKLKHLASLGRRQRVWLPWTRVLKQGIDQCRQPLEEVSRAVARCWQELAEHSGTMSISVRNSSIGQKILPKGLEVSDLGYEPVT